MLKFGEKFRIYEFGKVGYCPYGREDHMEQWRDYLKRKHRHGRVEQRICNKWIQIEQF